MYDVIVIGAGPGGYKAAELLSKQGKKVAVAEEDSFGGVCLNQGCIPLKTYLHFSRIRNEANKQLQAGLIEGAQAELKQDAILEYKNQIIRGLRQSIAGMLKAAGVELLRGRASAKENPDGTFAVKVGDEWFDASKIIIAAGSVEKRIPHASSKLIYSKDMLSLTALPESIDIVGGGAIGLEAASFFADAGCKVTIIEALDHIGGDIDEEMGNVLRRILEKRGVMIHTGTFLDRVEDDAVIYRAGTGEAASRSELVLVSIGRTPRIDETLMRELNIEYNAKGICVDDECRTSNPNVYACGDVTGKLMLAHTAYRQAKIISDALCGIHAAIDYHAIPRIIYTNPEALSIGRSERDCKAEGLKYAANSLPMTYSGKYFAENGKDGAKAKMIVDDNRRLIGFHMIGNGASEIALAAEMMILNKMSISDIKNLIIPHPTYGEIVSELAGLF